MYVLKSILRGLELLVGFRLVVKVQLVVMFNLHWKKDGSENPQYCSEEAEFSNWLF